MGNACCALNEGPGDKVRTPRKQARLPATSGGEELQRELQAAFNVATTSMQDAYGFTRLHGERLPCGPDLTGFNLLVDTVGREFAIPPEEVSAASRERAFTAMQRSGDVQGRLQLMAQAEIAATELLFAALFRMYMEKVEAAGQWEEDHRARPSPSAPRTQLGHAEFNDVARLCAAHLGQRRLAHPEHAEAYSRRFFTIAVADAWKLLLACLTGNPEFLESATLVRSPPVTPSVPTTLADEEDDE